VKIDQRFLWNFCIFSVARRIGSSSNKQNGMQYAAERDVVDGAGLGIC